MEKPTINERIDILAEMLKSGFVLKNYDGYYEDDEEILTSLLEPYKPSPSQFFLAGYSRVRRIYPKDPAKVFFRMLILYPEAINHEFTKDMYKTTVSILVSECSRYVVSFELYKNEPKFYFYVKQELFSNDPDGEGVRVDDSKRYATNNEEAIKFFETFTQAIESNLGIYISPTEKI